MTEQLTLNSLHIYTHDKGKTYSCSAQFSAYGNEVKLQLDPELAAQILRLCMDDIVAAVSIASSAAVEALGAAAAKQIEASKEADTDNDIPF